jgi:hypothetical protein
MVWSLHRVGVSGGGELQPINPPEVPPCPREDAVVIERGAAKLGYLSLNVCCDCP